MLVALIAPPQLFTKSQVTAGIVPPLGPMYLATTCKEEGHTVSLIDAPGEKYNQFTEYCEMTLRGLTFGEIIERIPSKTTIVGISCLFSSAHFIITELVRRVREKFPKVTIVLGGAHATVLSDFMLETTDADIIVKGEGEETLVELINNLDDYSQVAGIVFKRNGDIVTTGPRERIKDINSIPIPDRSLISMENYFKANEPHGAATHKRWTTLLASRGCPYCCTFCTTPKIWTRKWYTRDPEQVVKEMVELYNNYGVSEFHFEDENMGVSKAWMNTFCDLLIEKNLPISWQPSNGLRVENLNQKGLLEKMKQSGCSLIIFTVEAASERVRNQIIKKSLKLESLDSVLPVIKKVGIKSTCYFIIGLPGETKEEALESVDYAASLGKRGLDEVVIGIFAMIPGCDLFFDYQKKNGIKITKKFLLDLVAMGDLSKGVSWTEHITDQELARMRMKGYFKFMFYKLIFHPLKIFRSGTNVLFGRDELKSERVIRVFLKRLIGIK